MKMGRPLKDRKTLDLVLHAEGEKHFDLRGFTDTVVGLGLAVDTGTESISFANLESTLDNFRLTLDWDSLQLSAPTRPATEIALQKSFKAPVDGESRKVLKKNRSE